MQDDPTAAPPGLPGPEAVDEAEPDAAVGAAEAGAEAARVLADAVEEALPGWVQRSVRRRMTEAGREPEPAVDEAAARAGREAAVEVGGAVRSLVMADIDAQATTPLSLLRGAVRYPSAVLQQAGVPPVERDEMQERLFPDDVYDLAPATFADVDPALAEPGLAWGASKAFLHMRRHRKGKRS